MKAVFFDLDGTLFYTLEDIKAAIDYAIKAYDGESVPLDDVRRYVGRGLRRALAQAIVDHCPPLADEDEQTLMQALMMRYYENHPVVHTTIYPGIEDMLKMLKDNGIIIGVISNKADDILHSVLRKLSPVAFDFVAGAKPSVPLKPDPTVLLKAIDSFGLEKKDVIFVGDSPVDKETADRAGISSIIVSYGFSTPAELEEKGIEHVVNTEMLTRLLSQLL